MMGPVKLPTLRALLAAVGTGAWQWEPADLTRSPHIWRLVHPGAVNAVNVFAYGPPLSLQARVIAALHPGILCEVSDAEWAAQEARERLVMVQGLLHIVLADAGAMRPEQGALLALVVRQLSAAATLLTAPSPALARVDADPPAMP